MAEAVPGEAERATVELVVVDPEAIMPRFGVDGVTVTPLADTPTADLASLDDEPPDPPPVVAVTVGVVTVGVVTVGVLPTGVPTDGAMTLGSVAGATSATGALGAGIGLEDAEVDPVAVVPPVVTGFAVGSLGVGAGVTVTVTGGISARTTEVVTATCGVAT